jgi:hypothetical protein
VSGGEQAVIGLLGVYGTGSENNHDPSMLISDYEGMVEIAE